MGDCSSYVCSSYLCAMYFKGLWDQRIDQPGGNDLISMMAHSPATRDMPFLEFLGNLLLLIVGGNDTTRNSISGGVLALNQNPDAYLKLNNDPGLITSMVPEIIRWQRSEEHTSELQSLMRISYAVFRLKKQNR